MRGEREDRRELGPACYGRMCRLEDLIGMGYLNQSFQQEPIRNLSAYVAVFAWAVSLEKVFTLPSIIFYLDCCHKIAALRNQQSIPQETTKGSRNLTAKIRVTRVRVSFQSS